MRLLQRKKIINQISINRIDNLILNRTYSKNNLNKISIASQYIKNWYNNNIEHIFIKPNNHSSFLSQFNPTKSSVNDKSKPGLFKTSEATPSSQRVDDEKKTEEKSNSSTTRLQLKPS